MSAVDVSARQTAWDHLFHIIREQFPYSKMKGLTVKGGAVVSFDEVQFTLVFGRGTEPLRPLLPDTFDEPWLRFMRFCLSLQDGVVGEVHFTDGRPVLVSMRQAGMHLSATPASENRAQGGEEQTPKTVVA